MCWMSTHLWVSPEVVVRSMTCGDRVMRRHYLMGLISPIAKPLTPHEHLFTTPSVFLFTPKSVLSSLHIYFDIKGNHKNIDLLIRNVNFFGNSHELIISRLSNIGCKGMQRDSLKQTASLRLWSCNGCTPPGPLTEHWRLRLTPPILPIVSLIFSPLESGTGLLCPKHHLHSFHPQAMALLNNS